MLTALEQVLRVMRPLRPHGYVRGLLLARDMIAGVEVGQPTEASPGFLAGLRYGHALIEEHGDPDTVLMLIDEELLRAYVER